MIHRISLFFWLWILPSGKWASKVSINCLNEDRSATLNLRHLSLPSPSSKEALLLPKYDTLSIFPCTLFCFFLSFTSCCKTILTTNHPTLRSVIQMHSQALCSSPLWSMSSAPSMTYQKLHSLPKPLSLWCLHSLPLSKSTFTIITNTIPYIPLINGSKHVKTMTHPCPWTPDLFKIFSFLLSHHFQ